MSSRPRIHQIITNAADGDAITQMALSIQEKLSLVATSNIYSFWNHSEEHEERIKPFSELPPTDEVDVLVYHSSIGHPEVHQTLMNRSDKVVLMYHNITPSHFYRDFNPEFADLLDLGREELKLLQPRVSLVIADSQFNADDIAQYGYTNIEVIPAGFSPYRLKDQLVDAPLVRTLNSQFHNGFILVVGQVLPHKRVEQTVEAVHLLNSTYQLGVGLIICGAQRQHAYSHSLSQHIKSLPFVGVKMTGSVSDQHLATYYKTALLYLSMSDHEGLCIPPTEAMAVGTPVVAKGAGAIPETLGDGALLLPESSGPVLAAEAMYEVLRNENLKLDLKLRGRRQARELDDRDNIGRSVSFILSVV